MKKALIAGIAGQDGYYLTKLLLGKGYEVYGIDIREMNPSTELNGKLSSMSIIDLNDQHILVKKLKEIKPDEIYYLAAHHFSSQSHENRTGKLDPFIAVNLTAVNSMLDVLKVELAETKLFYAASAHIYGAPAVSPQTEDTLFNPDTPYAISKCAGIYLCRYFRKTFGIFTAVGIMYNHESPMRSMNFVTSQIARAAALAYMAKAEPLELKDLDAVVDWGAAKDYAEAMWLTLQQDHGDEYIIASGIPRTVRDFANEAFRFVDLDASKYVFQKHGNCSLDRKPYVGDNSRISAVCQWSPTTSFGNLVGSMVQFHIDALKRG